MSWSQPASHVSRLQCCFHFLSKPIGACLSVLVRQRPTRLYSPFFHMQAVGQFIVDAASARPNAHGVTAAMQRSNCAP